MQSRKRHAEQIGGETGSSKRHHGTSCVISSFDLLRRSFPLDRFDRSFPPVIFRHQLYSVLPSLSRTEIDREVSSLRQRRILRCFRFDLKGDEIALVRTDDYNEHVREFAGNHAKKDALLIERFLDFIESRDLSVSSNELKSEGHFSDDCIQTLVKIGVIIVKDVGIYWLSFPGAGLFMKAFVSGREKTLTMVKKAKYSCILEPDLISRPLPKRCLGMSYAVHDIIGSELVDVSETTSGRLLRYRR